jgi:ketosteroid isomerase-like protein
MRSGSSSEAAMAKRLSAKASSEANMVKSVNNAYYKALSARDICAMERVWSCGSNNILIAPPTNPVTHVGWEAIKRNWEAYWPMFSQFSVSMVVTRVNVNGPVAWVHGIETSRRRSQSGEVTSSRNYGTNIFVNHDDNWLLEFHQSALIPESS